MRGSRWRGIRSRRCSVGEEFVDRNAVNGIEDHANQRAYVGNKGERGWRQQIQTAAADRESSE
jgi:hypothetical protein